jgi:hypothetical protein
VNLGANLTIGSAVTVNDIKINLSGNQLIIEGKASKLIVEDGGAAEQVTVAAGATVTDSTLILNVTNNNDLLIVRQGILKDSTVVANATCSNSSHYQIGWNA